MELTPGPKGTPVFLGGGRGNFTKDKTQSSGGSTPPGDAPTLTDVYPNYGSIDGGTPLTLTGTNFSSPTVTLGGVACTDVVRVNSTTITCTSPAGVFYGQKDVVVTEPTGIATLPGMFCHSQPLTLPALSPSSGPTFGGVAVLASSTLNALAAVTEVRVDGNACTGLLSLPTLFQFVVPAGTSGAKTVAVTTANGDVFTFPAAFTYNAPSPTITSVLPAGGATAGGTPLTLIGTDFAPSITSVTIDGNACTSVVRVSQTQVTCVSPAGTSGSKTVTITNSDGSSASSAYNYSDSQIYVGSITPVGGQTAGGTAVTVRGSNFVSGATVTIGGAAATSVVFVDATTLTCVTPSRTAGAKDVVVTNPDTSAATLTGGYNYAARPTITSDQTGPTGGGKAVSVATGSAQSGATLAAGGTPMATLYFGGATSLRVVTPAGAGSQALVLTNPDGQFNSAARTFTFNDNPHPVSIRPQRGPAGGGQTVSVYGSQFQPGCAVTIDGNACTSVVRRSDSEITCVTPVGTGGAEPTVTNPDALTGVTPTNTYAYNSATVTVTSLNVTTGPASGGTAVTVTGTSFGTGSLVVIGGARAASVVIVSSTTITCVTPPGAVGAADVVVQNTGQASGTLAGGFTYT